MDFILHMIAGFMGVVIAVIFLLGLAVLYGVFSKTKRIIIRKGVDIDVGADFDTEKDSTIDNSIRVIFTIFQGELSDTKMKQLSVLYFKTESKEQRDAFLKFLQENKEEIIQTNDLIKVLTAHNVI